MTTLRVKLQTRFLLVNFLFAIELRTWSVKHFFCVSLEFVIFYRTLNRFQPFVSLIRIIYRVSNPKEMKKLQVREPQKPNYSQLIFFSQSFHNCNKTKDKQYVFSRLELKLPEKYCNKSPSILCIWGC